jgi:hypothetical protein
MKHWLEEYSEYFKREADRDRKKANSYLIAIGGIVILLFILCL